MAFIDIEDTLSDTDETVKLLMTNRQTNLDSIEKETKNIQKNTEEMR